MENGQIDADVVSGGDFVYVTATTWTSDSATPEAERVFSPSTSNAVAINTSTGSIEWTSTTDPSFGRNDIVDDMLVVYSSSKFDLIRLTDGSVRSGIKYTTDLVLMGDVGIDGDQAYAVGLVGDDLMVFKFDGKEILQTWRIPGVATGQYNVYGSVFAWQDGLLVLTPDGKLYRIAPESDVSTPIAMGG